MNRHSLGMNTVGKNAVGINTVGANTPTNNYSLELLAKIMLENKERVEGLLGQTNTLNDYLFGVAPLEGENGLKVSPCGTLMGLHCIADETREYLLRLEDRLIQIIVALRG